MNPSKGFPDTLVQAALDDALSAGSRLPLLAITGLQGSGKSTLAAQVVEAAARRGLRAATLSIDDVYLTRAERRELAHKRHPLLETRGPPGTHDLALALRTLDALAAGEPTLLPRFDKLSDDRHRPDRWTRVDHPLDLLVIEGWFLGTPPESEAALLAPINTLERDEDADGRWRRAVNESLGRDYPALWQRFDRLWYLQAPGFEIVPEWRWQQEQALQAAEPGRKGMTREQVERFVQFYERISRQAMRTLPGIADRTVQLDEQRTAQAD